jgi:hypothetical protein
LRDPSSAIVGTEFMVIHHHDAAIRFLDENLARGHQDSEVCDSLRFTLHLTWSVRDILEPPPFG